MALDEAKIPTHVAIILDGNGTWAKKRGLPRVMGHRKGAKTLVNITKSASKIGIKYLTLFCFSTENWSRPDEEVEYLMDLPKQLLNEYGDTMKTDNIKLLVIGTKERLSSDVIEKIDEYVASTRDNTGMTLIIAFNYGGKKELSDACKKIAKLAVDGVIDIDDIDESMVNSNLYTLGIPDVDLMIRTSGQYRISNFLLWQCAYSEFYFPKTLWPDFKEKDLEKAILEYNNRQRRFGGIK